MTQKDSFLFPKKITKDLGETFHDTLVRDHFGEQLGEQEYYIVLQYTSVFWRFREWFGERLMLHLEFGGWLNIRDLHEKTSKRTPLLWINLSHGSRGDRFQKWIKGHDLLSMTLWEPLKLQRTERWNLRWSNSLFSAASFFSDRV